MRNTRQLFHILSYIQYPLMVVVLYYYVHVIISITKHDPDWSALNSALVFLGILIGFSTLQDTTKTQNKISRKIWESPKKGRIALYIIFFLVLLFLITGLIGFMGSREGIYKEVSFGLLMLGIGMLGMLKGAIEMFENHRKDK